MISVSVIIPVLNAERFLRDALATVVAQTYRPFEILVIDGASTDETPRIAQSFSDVRYVCQTGTGLWNAMNQGIQVAQGQALAFLSSDDLWHPDKLRLQVEWLETHPETQAVFCYSTFITIGQESVLAIAKPDLFGASNPTYITEAMMARHELFETLGQFDEGWNISSDIDWFGRMFDSGIQTHMLADTLVTKRFHDSNLSTKQSSAPIYNHEVLKIMRQRILRGREKDGAA